MWDDGDLAFWAMNQWKYISEHTDGDSGINLVVSVVDYGLMLVKGGVCSGLVGNRYRFKNRGVLFGALIWRGYGRYLAASDNSIIQRRGLGSCSSSRWDFHFHYYVLTIYVRLYWILELVFFNLLYVVGTYARLVYSWYIFVFRTFAVLIVVHAANEKTGRKED